MTLEPLSEIAEIVMGQSPPSSTYNQIGKGLPFFQGKADFGDRYPNVRIYCNQPTKIAERGDILISVRAPVGPTNIAPSQCCIGRGLAAIRGKKVDPTFLLHFFRYHEPQLATHGKGSTFEAINRDDLENLPVPIPTLDNQRLIAAILEKADRLRRTRRYARQLSDTFLQSVFLKMFGDPLQNSRNWDMEALGEKLNFLTSGSRGWAKYYRESGDLFLRIQNVGKNRLLLDDLTFVQPPKNAEGSRTVVQPGEVLLSITADLGRAAVVPKDLPKAYINQHLALLRLRNIDPVFVAALLSSPEAKATVGFIRSFSSQIRPEF